MDPFSAEGELINIHSAFHQGQYTQVLDFDTSALSPENQLPARILKLRAHIALSQPAEAIAEADNDPTSTDLAAVKALAQHAAGNADAALELAGELAGKEPDNVSVQVLCGTVLHACGRGEEALGLLGRHQGDLEAVALIVQIHLQQNRSDLALKEVQTAKRWAQDSLLVNLAESWVGMRVVRSPHSPFPPVPGNRDAYLASMLMLTVQGGEHYQSAFYVYEELASAPSTSAALSIVGQAVAEIHLGRLPEAEAALNMALEKYPEDVQLIANSVVVNVLAGKGTDELEGRLRQVQSDHALLSDVQEKSAFFDTAAAKYAPRVSS